MGEPAKWCPNHLPPFAQIMEATWRHRPDDRPSFSQLVGLLEEARPDQLQAVLPASATRGHGLLDYSQGEIITVLDKQPQLQAGLEKTRVF
jgi:hypothetical protein